MNGYISYKNAIQLHLEQAWKYLLKNIKTQSAVHSGIRTIQQMKKEKLALSSITIDGF